MKPLPFDLSEKINTPLQTISNNADPKMEIAVARAKSTVSDSTYWTVETIREIGGLGDVSVAPRRFKSYGRPNRIYEIHVRDGVVNTSIREYPDKLKEGFKTQFSLGPGTSVSIAFNGFWERNRKLWRLITDESPWIFWVDNNGILWRQLWDDISTKEQLDTQVLRVRAIRAWKNVNFADKDQGIIVGYIKMDGTVWYRNYCQQIDYSYIWENARQLTEFVGVGVNINLFITNDYRMGFMLEDSLHQVHWLITPRNWAGMALDNEKITITPKISAQLIPLTYHNWYTDEILTVTPKIIAGQLLFSRTDNTLIEIGNIATTRINDELEEYEDWGFKINVKFNFPTETNPIIELTDTTTLSTFTISNIFRVNTTEFDVYVDDIVHEFGINTVYEKLGINITGMTNAAGYSYEMITQEFTPINLVPPFIPLPVVEVMWNE